MELGISLFRITQTALNNVERHAETDRAKVSLRGGSDRLELVVEDAGRGFDTTSTRATEGIGLASMQERVRLVQGEMEVRSRPRQGTRIEVRVPLVATESIRAAVPLQDQG